jgi:hypothetical protein
MRFASTVRPDGTKVVAVFNYDCDEPIEVNVAGKSHTIASYSVKFIEVKM